MILEGTYCSFGGVAAMDAGRDQLEVDVFFAHELLERIGTFVVEAL